MEEVEEGVFVCTRKIICVKDVGGGRWLHHVCDLFCITNTI